MSEVDLNNRIQSFLQSAFKSINTRDYNNAVRDLKAAEVLDSQNPEVLYNLGITYSKMGLYKTAVEYFVRVVKLPKTFIDLQMVKKLLAFSYINLGSFKNSLEILDTLLKDSPHDFASLNMKAYCLEKTGNPGEAMKIYRVIMQEDSKNATACNSLAYLTAETGGDLNMALKLAQYAIKEEPGNPFYLDTIGYIYLKLGKYDKAKEYLEKALELIPLSEEIREHYRLLPKK